MELKSHLPIEGQARVIGVTWLEQQLRRQGAGSRPLEVYIAPRRAVTVQLPHRDFDHLARVQEFKMPEIASSTAIQRPLSNTIVNAVVENMKAEHDAWIAVFNRRVSVARGLA